MSVAAVAACLSLAACGGSSSASEEKTQSGPSTFVAKGTVTVVGSGVTGDNIKCHGYRGYDDMQEGAQVKVAVDGKTVGIGSLKSGTSSDGGYSCKFGFEVRDVPSGNKFYSVTVTHRGSIDYKEDELKSGVSLQLGS